MSGDLSFGQWLKRQRRRLDLTQEELAARVGYATTTIRRVEADELKPSKELADKLAVALDLPAHEQAAFVQFARGVGSAPLASVPSVSPPPPAPRSNLPHPVSSFIGRERELAEVQTLLARSRLVTLTGVGGTGKTRLALQVAHHLSNGAPSDHLKSSIHTRQFSDGVWWVDLAPVADADLVVTTMAQTLGAHEHGQRSRFEVLKDTLRDKRLLLILDNFEQVLAAAPRLADLLAVAPGLTFLVTSRAALQLRGEKEYPVPPLALPQVDGGVGQAMPSEAVRLFVERAADIKPGFALDQTNASAITAICRRLDGLPLAIELAAARSRVYSPPAMLRQLAGATPLGFLTGGARDLPARQQTLRDTISWSYHLLSTEEQTLFRRLGVFAGGFGLPAAEAVVGPLTGLAVVDGVEALAGKSLVKPVEGVDGEPRFTLLETLREYAREQLTAQGETEETRQRHADFYLAMGEEGEWGLRGPQQRTWLDRLEMEHDNLRAALSWLLASPDGGVAALRLAGAMEQFWWYHSHLQEGWNWLTQALAHPGAQAGTAARAKALYVANHLASDDHERLGKRWLDEGIAIFREVDDKFGLALALRAKAQTLYSRG
ncbi:MAG: XRE family transcriptional regulator, partial [Anaerolineae bacterium]|nr:XRE family transcriptional regulator [Anaerolineae bacterium]